MLSAAKRRVPNVLFLLFTDETPNKKAPTGKRRGFIGFSDLAVAKALDGGNHSGIHDVLGFTAAGQVVGGQL